jgi:hypothetical protein
MLYEHVVPAQNKVSFSRRGGGVDWYAVVAFVYTDGGAWLPVVAFPDGIREPEDSDGPYKIHPVMK